VAVLSYRPLIILNGVLIATLLLLEHRRKSLYHILRIENGMQGLFLERSAGFLYERKPNIIHERALVTGFEISPLEATA